MKPDYTPAQDTDLSMLDVSRPELFQTNTHWPLFARLRRESPVHFCKQSPYGPYWSITRYDDIVEVEKNVSLFSSEDNIIIGDISPRFDCTQAFATSDPPLHTRERKAVQPAVSQTRMAALEKQTRQKIADILDALPRNETFDWAQSVATEITTLMVATLFDFPLAERHKLAYWSEVLVTTPQPGALVETWDERESVITEYRDRLLRMWQQRAADDTGEDILSALAHNDGTSQMIDEPLRLVGTVSLIAGANEASRGAISGSIVAFNQYPQEWRKLRNDPSLLDNAVDEIVRWQTPITHMRRTATENFAFRGHEIQRGDKVIIWYCSGNRDETQFSDSHRLDISRANARRHLSYGYGIHRCLGQHVARMELRILLEEMLNRFQRVELAGEATRIASNFSANYSEVPVRIYP